MDANNEKALFRRGESLFGLKEFERARDDFTRVTQLYPANRAAKAQVQGCQKHIKEQHEKDKRLYAGMFQKFAERDAKVMDDTKVRLRAPVEQVEFGMQTKGQQQL